MNKYAVIMAAGKGTRMKSRNPNISKVTFPIIGKELVNYVLDAVEPLGLKKTIVVVGFGGETTKACVENRADVVWQKEQLGTGHAVMQAAPLLKDKEGCTIVLCGDTPLITANTLKEVFNKHEKEGNDMTVVSSILENPKGYGRIVRQKPANNVITIREDKDCSEHEKDIHEINAGIYIFNNKLLFEYLDKITPNNAQGEYYLTDLVNMFFVNGHKIGAYIATDAVEIFGINDRAQLSYAAKIIRKRTNKEIMLSGVSMEDPDSAFIQPGTIIGRDTIILPNVYIVGNCVIGEGNIIGPNTTLKNVKIGNDSVVQNSWLENVEIEDNQKIGPFERLLNN